MLVSASVVACADAVNPIVLDDTRGNIVASAKGGVHLVRTRSGIDTALFDAVAVSVTLFNSMSAVGPSGIGYSQIGKPVIVKVSDGHGVGS